ncbi:unnamed protein product, partial [Prorocentrum cordatum]
MQDKLYDGLHLSTAAAGTRVRRNGAQCFLADHMKSPHFAFDPDMNGMMFRNIPPAVSTWDIRDALKRCTGFLGCACSTPEHKELLRDTRANFASRGDLQDALKRLSDEKPDWPVPCALAASVRLETLVAPPEMSLPDRICKDVELSSQV